MTSKKVAALLADLEVTRSLSTPHVCNDNPFSEARFKTLKYTPTFPDRFVASPTRNVHRRLLDHYNQHHRHSGIGFHTPADVHAGRHHTIPAQPARPVLDNAYTANPHRFRQRPTAPQVPDITWINQPETNLSHTP